MQTINNPYILVTFLRRLPVLMLLVLSVFVCIGCGEKDSDNTYEQDTLFVDKPDSLTYKSQRHYTLNYNFIVAEDTLFLRGVIPGTDSGIVLSDTIRICKGDRIVVVDIEEQIHSVSSDSIWVQVARDQDTFGWITESEMLSGTVPDNPISLFIAVFSDTHLYFSVVILLLISAAYLIRKIYRRKSHLVHLNDIPSFYPAMLALIVAMSAVLYSSIQLFTPQTWEHFYYNPTLNPFNVPLVLSVYIFSLWLMLVVALAAVDVVRHSLPFGEAILYLCGLCGVCAINYIVFSVSTLYYIGYPLLIFYVVFAVRMYLRNFRTIYICGHCGERMREMGRCQACGTLND